MLGRDVLSARSDGLPLLRAGQALTRRYIDRLQESGIYAVYIDDAISEGINAEPVLSIETRQIATAAVAKAYSHARESVEQRRALPPDVGKRMGLVVEKILADIQNSDAAVMALADLAGADAYTFQHSIDVTAVGLLVGQRLYREKGWIDFRGQRRFGDATQRLYNLGMGLLLHDIGKLAVPVEILQKPGKLTEEEWKVVKTHPRAGIELLGHGDWSPLVKAVVLRHHERWDGTGYPGGKAGTEIHEMARIAAVADVYDAVTSSRVYQSARPPQVGVQVVCEGAGEGFDPEIVEIFRSVVPPFPAGTELKLADGRRGIVASVPPEQPDRPVVRIIEHGRASEEVSLLNCPELRIDGWHQPEIASREQLKATA